MFDEWKDRAEILNSCKEESWETSINFYVQLLIKVFPFILFFLTASPFPCKKSTFTNPRLWEYSSYAQLWLVNVNPISKLSGFNKVLMKRPIRVDFTLAESILTEESTALNFKKISRICHWSSVLAMN